jgi:glycosyltransferase involved in cell wall biosynthesis
MTFGNSSSFLATRTVEMKARGITTENTVFVIVSFEGRDPYSLAGGLGVRVTNLSETLADMGFPVHVFFIGDPKLPGEEVCQGGRLVLHRWCQWISQYHPNGVYDGEEGKLSDFNQSLPTYIVEHIAAPAISQGKLVAILGEEWQTAEAMCRISDLLHPRGLRDKAILFWNANNTLSFNRIDWRRLNYTTRITTVSRYMKHIMWGMGLNPLVIPNGIPKRLLEPVEGEKVQHLRQCLSIDGGTVLAKVARWDPDKRWHMAVESVVRLKQRGMRAVLLARGGIEPHGLEVLSRARSLGLTVCEAKASGNSLDSYFYALQNSCQADVIDIKFHLPQDFLRIIYRASDAVLANSGHEPFGMVGLETMAAGGIAFTGSTGEDYAIPYHNAFVLETSDPREIEGYLMHLQEYPEEGIRIRKEAQRTASYFTWEASAENLISKLENQARLQKVLVGSRPPLRLECKEPIEKRLLAIEADTIGTKECLSQARLIDKDNGATGHRLSTVGC